MGISRNFLKDILVPNINLVHLLPYKNWHESSESVPIGFQFFCMSSFSRGKGKKAGLQWLESIGGDEIETMCEPDSFKMALLQEENHGK